MATQIPIMVEERDGELFLLGHIMRKTDHHQALLENPQVLALFTGPHTYVSASWYTTPSIGSTWNYMSVHLHGKVRFMSNEELIGLMKKLTLHFEDQNTDSPTVYDNLPESFLSKMLPAIVGIEIKVEQLLNVFKLSQNRDEASYVNIIDQLEKRDEKGSSAMIAEEMRNRSAKLFPPGLQWDGSRFDS